MKLLQVGGILLFINTSDDRLIAIYQFIIFQFKTIVRLQSDFVFIKTTKDSNVPATILHSVYNFHMKTLYEKLGTGGDSVATSN